jgi:predicted ATPase
VLAREQGFVQLQAWAAVTGGWALAEAGDVAEGLARTRDGVAAIRALGSEDFKTYFLCLLAETLAKGDETEAALDVLTEALGAWRELASASTRRSFIGRRASCCS